MARLAAVFLSISTLLLVSGKIRSGSEITDLVNDSFRLDLHNSGLANTRKDSNIETNVEDDPSGVAVEKGKEVETNTGDNWSNWAEFIGESNDAKIKKLSRNALKAKKYEDFKKGDKKYMHKWIKKLRYFEKSKQLDDNFLNWMDNIEKDIAAKKVVRKSVEANSKDNTPSAKAEKEDQKEIAIDNSTTVTNLPKELANMPLWVLKLKDDLDNLKLSRGTWWEEKSFDDALAATIAANKGKHTVRNNTNAQQTEKQKATNENIDNETVKDLKKNVRRLVNKFILHVSKLPDSVLTDDATDDEPTLVIFIKGLYTSLTVRYKRKQWNFILGPGTPLPAWFYQPHPTDVDEIPVPRNVRIDLFKTLVHMLNAFIGFPV